MTLETKYLLIGKVSGLWLTISLMFVTAAAFDKYEHIVSGTNLEFALIVHRHGDRTPIQSSIRYSNDPEKLTELTEPYGWGQLTDVGKRRSYALGQQIQNRYKSLLTDRYNYSEVYIRSTDSTRTKMSILAALAAIYPPTGKSWNFKLNWTPVPYTTVPAKYDFNLGIINCPKLLRAVYALYGSGASALNPYSDVTKLLSNKTTTDFTKYPVLISSAYDLFVSQLSLGLPLDPQVQAILPRIKEAATVANEILFGNNTLTAIQAGALLNDFLQYATDVVKGKNTQKIRIYSAHDFNVYSLQAVSQIANKPGLAKYASAFSLELRSFPATGEYFVLPVYMPSPEEAPIYLQVSGCDRLCSFEQFINITFPYARDEDTWRSECEFTQDMVIDNSSIA